MNNEVVLDHANLSTPIDDTQVLSKGNLSSKDKLSTRAYLSRNSSKIFYIFTFLIIYFGWAQKEHSNLTPESGMGYFLGIFGGVLMLLLLLYPLRKKIRFLHRFGLIRHWFKMHMLFGVIGPVAILYHANFSLGSVNGNVALFSMIIVALSGLVGRYFYTKIHHGLYGRKASLQELRDSLLLSKGQLGENFTLSKKAAKLIKKAERRTLKNRNIVSATILWPIIKMQTKFTKFRLKRVFKKDFSKSVSAKKIDKKVVRALSLQASNQINQYIDNSYKIFGFRIFENLLSLWHIMHFPLFIMLVITGILHVVVVHSY